VDHPSVDLAVVIAAGRYSKPDQGVAPVKIWREIILASIVKA
jgi:hypothetical protein